MDIQLLGQLAALIFLETVMVVDNVVVIIAQCSALPEHQRALARRWGIMQGAILRMVLLLGVTYIGQLEHPIAWVHSLTGLTISWSQVLFITGGLLLLWMSIDHIEEATDPAHHLEKKKFASLPMVVFQLLGISLIFSVDSVLSLVGVTKVYWIMVVAVSVSVLVMLTIVDRLNEFIERFPGYKMLGLIFVGLIGGKLVSDGLGLHLVTEEALYGGLIAMLVLQTLNIVRRVRLQRHQVSVAS